MKIFFFLFTEPWIQQLVKMVVKNILPTLKKHLSISINYATEKME